MRHCILAAALVASLATTNHAQDCRGWVPLHDPISGTVMPLAENTRNGDIVNIGTQPEGQVNDDDASNETWTLRGGRWLFNGFLDSRSGVAPAFDHARGVMVWASDTTTYELLNGTWVAAGPTPDSAHQFTLAYDPHRAQVLRFRTAGQVVRAAAWNGESWSQIGEVPFTRVRWAATDPNTGAILLFSDLGASGLWLNGAWQPIAPHPLNPQLGYFLTYHTARERFMLVNGNEYFTLENGVWTLDNSQPPPPAGTRGMVYSQRHGGLVAVASTQQTNYASAETFVLRDGAWHTLSSYPSPEAEFEPAMAFHEARATTVFVGRSRRFNQTPVSPANWTLRGERWQREPGPGLDVLGGSAAYDAQQQRIVMVPLMQSGPENVSSTWTWDGRWVRESTTTTPRISTRFLLHANPVTSEVAYLTPGATVEFRDGHWQRSPRPGLTPSISQIVWDDARAAFITELPYFSPTTPKRLSRLDGNIWTTLSTPTIYSNAGTATVYDPAWGVVCPAPRYQGGADTLPIRETLLLTPNASDWTLSGLQSPRVRAGHGVVYDSVARRTIMYGGGHRETWKLAKGPARIEHQPAPVAHWDGAPAELFVIASGGGSLEYQWHKDGVPISDSPRISGTSIDSLQFIALEENDSGLYHCTVRNPCGSDSSISVQLTVNARCPGDYNLDGTRDEHDLAALSHDIASGTSLFPPNVPDINDDGGADFSDMVALAEFIAQGPCP